MCIEFAKMDIDYPMDLDDQTMTHEVNDIESELENLKEFNNEKQLDLLRREIGHIVAHGALPPEGWYDERFEYILMYSKLDWISLAKRYHSTDQYMHNTALYIMRLIDELLEERGTKPNFHIRTYHRMIHEIQNIWHYYKQIYCTNDEDDEMMNLIGGISNMCK